MPISQTMTGVYLSHLFTKHICPSSAFLTRDGIKKTNYCCLYTSIINDPPTEYD